MSAAAVPRIPAAAVHPASHVPQRPGQPLHVLPPSVARGDRRPRDDDDMTGRLDHMDDRSGGTLPVEIAPAWTPEAMAKDAAAFMQELAATAPPAARLDALLESLNRRVDEERAVGGEDCSFGIDVPGFGPLNGRIRVRQGHVEIHLRAARPALDTALRGMQPRLQRLIDGDSNGDVELLIL